MSESNTTPANESVESTPAVENTDTNAEATTETTTTTTTRSGPVNALQFCTAWYYVLGQIKSGKFVPTEDVDTGIKAVAARLGLAPTTVNQKASGYRDEGYELPPMARVRSANATSGMTPAEVLKAAMEAANKELTPEVVDAPADAPSDEAAPSSEGDTVTPADAAE